MASTLDRQPPQLLQALYDRLSRRLWCAGRALAVPEALNRIRAVDDGDGVDDSAALKSRR
jgi:hypothetical protein